MKQSQFTTVCRLSLGSLLLTVAIASCTKKSSEVTPTPVSDDEVAMVQKGKPGTPPVVSLRVTVNNSTGNNITSDGNIAPDNTGDYISGQQNVSATFDQAGNFIFNAVASGNPNASPTRWLTLNLNQEITATSPYSGIYKATYISTGKSSLFTTYTPLQNMTYSPVQQVQCIGFSTGPTGPNAPAATVNFHRAGEDVINSSSSFVEIKRISLTQWTMTPLSNCSNISNTAALRSGATVYGYYNIPFFFTLTSQL